MVESLLTGGRHTLCLNIATAGFDGTAFVAQVLAAKGKTNVRIEKEPNAQAFQELTDGLDGGIAIAEFEDLDHHPKSLDTLLAHVTKDKPNGKLVIVSRKWNSDNTERERELRKHCLFYQQAAPAPEPPPKKSR